MTVRNQIQQIALRWPAYGYRRVHAQLVRQGWMINHKRVLRLMRGDNLLCVRRRKFVFTTDSRHGLPIYPNLVEGLVVNSIDQLWVADITYIRLQMEFVYLAVLLDAFSRRCLGWALRRSLEAALALEALRMGLRHRRPKPGLVHHSDRGVQYASGDYTAELKQHGIRISMSRTASPYDNAQAESFMKTLKYEEVYRTEYRSLEDARAAIGEFLDKITTVSVCIRRSAIVRHWSSSTIYGAPKRRGEDEHEFSEAWGIYRSDQIGSTGSKRSGSLPALIGRDEFQPAIPWQVALQQSLPPLHRLRTILQNTNPAVQWLFSERRQPP
jgi:transposase InsO family protein